jgi:hypothetical protein
MAQGAALIEKEGKPLATKIIRRIVLFLTLSIASVSARAEDLPGTPAAISVNGVSFQRQLNGGAAAAQPTPDGISITGGAKTDFFRETDGATAYATAPVILSAIDNTRPFTFIARVTPELGANYDAGALYRWAREDKWLKFAFEWDERGLSRIVTVRTYGTSDDNNHDVLTAGSAFMTISSDTVSLGFYYSVDGRSWQLVRVFRNDYPPRIWLGLSAQSPTCAGNRARFEAVQLTSRSVTDFRTGQ